MSPNKTFQELQQNVVVYQYLYQLYLWLKRVPVRPAEGGDGDGRRGCREQRRQPGSEWCHYSVLSRSHLASHHPTRFFKVTHVSG